MATGNPNAYYRNVKFAVRRAYTIQQKNRGVAAFLFKFCCFNLHCNWCSRLRHQYCCSRSKFDHLADQIGHGVANGSLPLQCFFRNCVAQALSRQDEPQRQSNCKQTCRLVPHTAPVPSMLSVSKDAVNTNFNSTGLTRLRIKPESVAPEADALATGPSELRHWLHASA